MKQGVATGPGWELRLGRWQDVLASERGDVLLTDPPYSPRQAQGYRSGTPGRSIGYDALEEDQARELADWAKSSIDHWAVVFGDHITWSWFDRAFRAAPEGRRREGWLAFGPSSWVKTNPVPRLLGDGPCQATEWLFVARPRRTIPPSRRGSRPGSWESPRATCGEVVGAKPLELMRALVRAYTLRCDLVVDPYAGTGTTLAAAIHEGRRGLGAEADPMRWELAVRRLRLEERRAELAARQAELFPSRTVVRQLGLELAADTDTDTDGEEERGAC